MLHNAFQGLRRYGRRNIRVACGHLHSDCRTTMSNACTKATSKKGLLERIGSIAGNVSQTLISRIHVVTNTDRVEVGIKPARRGHDHIPSWHVMGFNKPRVGVAAQYLEAIEIGGRQRANEMLGGEERG